MTGSATQVRLRRNPVGAVRADDFELVEVPLPALAVGEVLVANRLMSIDPYMRLALSDQAGFLAAMRPGDAMAGTAVGVVSESRAPDLPVGTTVLSQRGWRSAFVAPAAELVTVDGSVPAAWHLGVLGLTGVTAWLGIERVLRPEAGETIFISGAAGAVGAVACQLAMLRGARVLGCAGSPTKVAWLIDEIGIEDACDYRTEPVDAFLRRTASGGIDCYFDNVGGTMLETVLDMMRPLGRVGLCGAMSRYETDDYRSGPRNFFTLIEKSLAVNGFNAFLLTPAETADIVAQLRAMALAGRLQANATDIHGLANAPAAFADLFKGGARGKLVIEI